MKLSTILFILIGFYYVYATDDYQSKPSKDITPVDTILIPNELDLKHVYVFIDRSSPYDLTVYISIYGHVGFDPMVYLLADYRGTVKENVRISVNNYVFIKANVSEPIFK